MKYITLSLLLGASVLGGCQFGAHTTPDVTISNPESISSAYARIYSLYLPIANLEPLTFTTAYDESITLEFKETCRLSADGILSLGDSVNDTQTLVTYTLPADNAQKVMSRHCPDRTLFVIENRGWNLMHQDQAEELAARETLRQLKTPCSFDNPHPASLASGDIL